MKYYIGMMNRTKMIPKEFNRFMRRVEKQESGCWTWKGGHTYNGYGVCHFLGKQMQAHHVAYMHWKGPIPKGKELHHKCRTRDCVNPDHSKPITHKQHMSLHAEERPVPTHCKRGHPFTDGSYWLGKNGARSCKACCDLRMGTKWHRLSGFCKNGHNIREAGTFYLSKRGTKSCKICRGEYMKSWLLNHPEAVARKVAATRIWRQSNKAVT